MKNSHVADLVGYSDPDTNIHTHTHTTNAYAKAHIHSKHSRVVMASVSIVAVDKIYVEFT